MRYHVYLGGTRACFWKDNRTPSYICEIDNGCRNQTRALIKYYRASTLQYSSTVVRYIQLGTVRRIFDRPISRTRLVPFRVIARLNWRFDISSVGR